jgi:hypothetical protein
MAINLATKYSKHVQERFFQESLTSNSFSKDLDVEFNGVKGVTVYEIGIAQMNDYTRSGANRYGTPEELADTKKDYIMNKDRSFTFTIDKGNNMEQLMIKNAGKALKRQLREVVTPEIDTYRFKVWSDNAGLTKALSGAVSKDTIYHELVVASGEMNNKLVPKKNRTLYVGTEAYNALLECEAYIRLEKLGSKAITSGVVGQILGMDVVYVPDVYMPAGVVFMIILKDAAISPVKLHEYQIHKDPPGISGHLVEGRFIYDAFVNETKKNGIYVATSA